MGSMTRICPDAGGRYAKYSRLSPPYVARRPREPGRACEQAFYRETDCSRRYETFVAARRVHRVPSPFGADYLTIERTKIYPG
jgi:hypothetical protein